MVKPAFIIGCGGIGGWVALNLIRLMPESRLYFIDGDKYEEHNLDRQLFDPNYIGMNKAKALRSMLCRAMGVDKTRLFVDDKYFTFDTGLSVNSDVFVCVDNHKARAAVLSAVDLFSGCTAYFGANEYIDAEAYIYQHGWKDSDLDPRVYYPDILTDETGDPLSPPCSGEEQERYPQLVTANMNSASHMMWLHYTWNTLFPKLTTPEAIDKLPVLLRSNGAGRVNVTTQGDLINGNV